MERRLDLTGVWTLVRRESGSRFPQQVPGDNLTALRAAEAVAEPYYGANELDLQWIGREDWVFETHFDVPSELLERSYHFLHFESIDTVAEIRLNGVLLGNTDNMFAAVRVPAPGLIERGNHLRVNIRGPETVATERAAALPYSVSHVEYPVQSPHRNLLRKVQCHAGWDWGPSLMVCGIYGEVYLGATDCERIESVRVFATPEPETSKRWTVEVDIELFAESASPVNVHAELVDLSGEGQGSVASARTVQLDAPTGRSTGALSLVVEHPRLWWPNGYGAQPLYGLRIESDNDRWSGTVGFRTLELITRPDEHGRSMVFRINGRDVFAKGANWIPADAMPGRITNERIESLLADAAAANMNMVRVWGGGRYESRHFYETCDRLGILVWQDFMFSCSLYPADTNFLESVRGEVRYQVTRLQHHPSIALWCGNNENVGALTWFEESRKDRDRYIIDYDRLNEGAVGATVRETDPSRPWWPSSPAAGPGDFSDNWHDDTQGDMHYWSVWHEGKPFEAYYEVTPRFCSEFGFQSFPSPQTVAEFAPPEQLNVTSPIMDHHQRSPAGNAVILATLARYFRFPRDFADFTYLSQVQQAMAITTAVEYWRTRRPVCMGALYWQLNDVWPVASWSSIEHSGRWKLLHYAARRFFRPLLLVLLSGTEVGTALSGTEVAVGETLEAWLVNDTAADVSGRLELVFYDFEGHPFRTEAFSCACPAESSMRVASLDAPRDRADGTYFCEARFVPATGATRHDTPDTSSTGVPHSPLEALRLSTVPKHCRLAEAQVQAAVGDTTPAVGNSTPAGAAPLTIELTTDRPAFFVSLSTPDPAVRFFDNGFHLLPQRGKRVVVENVAGHDANWLRENLSLTHLRASYE